MVATSRAGLATRGDAPRGHRSQGWESWGVGAADLEPDLSWWTVHPEWLPSPTAQTAFAEAALCCQYQERKESFEIGAGPSTHAGTGGAGLS